MLLRLAVGTDLATGSALGHDHRRALRVGSGARQLHRRQRGGREQQDAEFAHVSWFPEKVLCQHELINLYALGRIVAQFKFARGFISTRSRHLTAAIHVPFSVGFQRLDRTRETKAGTWPTLSLIYHDHGAIAVNP
ncbi:hypothetical protein [Bradyrhizobium sp. HKCCYLS20291]|uniref:hypothetical protein n=1 Tax=Bradyrhizobium sp. HKCCYLS20291 TaxID=3420766 RepID=UPI003EB8A640